MIKGEEKKAEEELAQALKACPAYTPMTAPGVAPVGMPVTVPGGGAGEGVLDSDGEVYEIMS